MISPGGFLRRGRLFKSSRAKLDSCGSAVGSAGGSSVVILCTKERTSGRHLVLKAGQSVGAQKYMWWMFINVDVDDVYKLDF